MAAVGVSGNLTFVVLALTQMLGVGTTTLVSHAVGRKDSDAARRVFNQAQSLSLIAGAGSLVVGLALTPAYAAAFSADAATAALVRQFLWWFVPAMALQFALVAVSSALRGMGDFKPGMIVGSTTVVINMALAPVLIFGWGTGVAFGVAGAAMASLVAIAVGVAWLDRMRSGRGLPARAPRRDGADRGLEAVARHRAAGRGRVRPDRGVHGRGLRGEPAVRRRRAGGFRHRPAGRAGRLHADRRAGLRRTPVAGQNFGAHLGHRVRATFRIAALLAVSGMACFVAICQLFRPR